MIQIKAKQQNVSFEKNVEKLAFVLSAHLYNTLESSKVIEEAAKRSVEAALVKKEKATSASQVLVAVKEQSKQLSALRRRLDNRGTVLQKPCYPSCNSIRKAGFHRGSVVEH